MIVNPGGTNQSFVDEHIKQAQIIRVQNNVDNLQALRQKTADMMVTDLIEGDYYQSKEPGVFCVANETPFAGTASNKVYMMSKDNPALLKKVNQWLDSRQRGSQTEVENSRLTAAARHRRQICPAVAIVHG